MNIFAQYCKILVKLEKCKILIAVKFYTLKMPNFIAAILNGFTVCRLCFVWKYIRIY